MEPKPEQSEPDPMTPATDAWGLLVPPPAELAEDDELGYTTSDDTEPW